jgi:hypothetical protein
VHRGLQGVGSGGGCCWIQLMSLPPPAVDLPQPPACRQYSCRAVQSWGSGSQAGPLVQQHAHLPGGAQHAHSAVG